MANTPTGQTTLVSVSAGTRKEAEAMHRIIKRAGYTVSAIEGDSGGGYGVYKRRSYYRFTIDGASSTAEAEGVAYIAAKLAGVEAPTGLKLPGNVLEWVSRQWPEAYARLVAKQANPIRRRAQNPDAPTATVKTVKSGKSARYALTWRVSGNTSYQSNLTGRRLLDELAKGRRELPGLEVKYENSRRVRNGALAFAKESHRDAVSHMLARHKTPAVKGHRVYLAKLGSQDTRYIKGGARYLIVGEGISQKDMADWWRQAVEKSHGEPVEGKGKGKARRNGADDIKRIKQEIAATKAEMKRLGIRRTSFMNGGLSALESRYNEKLFRLDTELKRAENGSTLDGLRVRFPIAYGRLKRAGSTEVEIVKYLKQLDKDAE